MSKATKVEHSEAKRIKKLRLLLTRLRQSKSVQNRDLQTWLGEQGYAEYEQRWQEQKDLRSELNSKPNEVRKYEALLKRANFAYNRAEGYDNSLKGNAGQAEQLYHDAERECERALEYLQEAVAADPALRAWFDRDTDWTPDGSVNPDPASMPQIVTSKSHRKLTNKGGLLMGKQTKRDVKIAAIEQELERLKHAKGSKKAKLPSVSDLLKAVRDGD